MPSLNRDKYARNLTSLFTHHKPDSPV